MTRVRVTAKMVRSGGVWYRKGETPDLPKREVDRLSDFGAVETLSAEDGDGGIPADDPAHEPEGVEIPVGLPDTLDGLREFAAERSIKIPSSARTKPQITAVIVEALSAEDGDGDE